MYRTPKTPALGSIEAGHQQPWTRPALNTCVLKTADRLVRTAGSGAPANQLPKRKAARHEAGRLHGGRGSLQDHAGIPDALSIDAPRGGFGLLFQNPRLTLSPTVAAPSSNICWFNESKGCRQFANFVGAHRTLKFNLMGSADCEPTSASRLRRCSESSRRSPCLTPP
jgi:hypothetical protein